VFTADREGDWATPAGLGGPASAPAWTLPGLNFIGVGKNSP